MISKLSSLTSTELSSRFILWRAVDSVTLDVDFEWCGCCCCCSSDIVAIFSLFFVVAAANCNCVRLL